MTYAQTMFRLLTGARLVAVASVSFVALIAVTGCGSDFDATQSADAASDPTPPPALESLTAEQVLERAIAAMDQATSFEANGVETVVDADAAHVTTTRARKSSPTRTYGYSESPARAREEVQFDGTRYERRADSAEELQTMRWQSSSSRQSPLEYSDAAEALRMIEDPAVTVDEAAGHYVLSGTVDAPVLYGGFSSTKSTKFEPGPFIAIISPVTFTPVSVTHEMTQVTTDRDDPEFRQETVYTVKIEYRSFNQPVEVSPPAADMVDDLVRPTPTAAPTSTTMPTAYPTATAAPFGPTPTSTAAAFPGATPTPTPFPPPQSFPTPVQATPYEEFVRQIEAAAPSDRFEVLPGMTVVYEPCGGESDGIVTARLFDMSNAGTSSSGYMAFIYIELSAGTWTVEYPGLTSSAAIKVVIESDALMQQVVERAGPAARCP